MKSSRYFFIILIFLNSSCKENTNSSLKNEDINTDFLEQPTESKKCSKVNCPYPHRIKNNN